MEEEIFWVRMGTEHSLCTHRDAMMVTLVAGSFTALTDATVTAVIASLMYG
jgi:hypothetical protein